MYVLSSCSSINESGVIDSPRTLIIGLDLFDLRCPPGARRTPVCVAQRRARAGGHPRAGPEPSGRGGRGRRGYDVHLI